MFHTIQNQILARTETKMQIETDKQRILKGKRRELKS